MYDRLMDFDTLVAALNPSIAPTFASLRAIQDPRAVDALGQPLVLPIRGDAWWSASGTSNPREVLDWPYKVNGGSVMICMAGDGSGQPIGPTAKSLLVWNYYNHPSSFGSNKNRFDDANPDGWPREFSRVSAFGNAPFAEAWWEGPPGNPILGPKEQAIEAGDIVVFVQENFGMSINTALLRTQEAVWFTRNEFSPAVPGISPPLALTIEGAYPHGNSFGQAMAAFLCLMQPQYYRGAVDWITSDLGFELGDFSDLQWHFSAGLDRVGYQASTDNFFADMYSFVDQLGIRFDAPENGQAGWDMAAFSLNRRPSDVKLPMDGHVGEHEFQYPGSWSANDHLLFAAGSTAKLTLYRNRAHEEQLGVLPGVNEYALFTGNEWAAAKNSNPQQPINRVVPLPPALGGPPVPQKPYPDPYTHTLRPPPSGAVGGNVLTAIDARAGMDGTDAYHGDGYRHPVAPPATHPIKSIGHGILPGYRDQMRVADLDADGEMEVLFGNLDGYVHILEFAGNGSTSGSVGNPDDPYRLIDEWQSPRLGLGVFACDAAFNPTSGLATIYFADARGQVWRIQATGANSYVVGNGGLPIITPAANNPLVYDGSTPLLLLADFDGGNSGNEILLVNRFYDWSLFTTSGVALNVAPLDSRVQRSTRTNGMTDAFIIEAVDGDTQKEVLLSSANGGAWSLNRMQSSPSWTWQDPPLAAISPSTCSRVKVVPCNFNGGTTPSHLLSFCRDSDRDDAAVPAGWVTGPDLIEIFDSPYTPNGAPPPPPPPPPPPATPPPPQPTYPKYAEIDSAVRYSSHLSFAWIDKPKSSSPIATFAIAAGRTIATYSIDVTSMNAPIVAPTSSVDLATLYDDGVLLSEEITSLECALLEGPSGGKSKCLVFCTSKGRIFTVDTNFTGLRDSSEEFGPTLPPAPSGENPYQPWTAWPSNRSLSQIAACDLVAPKDVSGAPIPDQGNFYFAEYTVPGFRQVNAAGFVRPRYRIGRIGIGTGTGAANEWQAFVARPNSGSDWESLRPSWTRSMSVEDFVTAADGSIQPDGNLEFRLFTETGVAYVDEGAPGGAAVREFQTSSRLPRSVGGGSVQPWLDAIALGYPVREQFGGRVFEMRADRVGGRYWHLSGFTPPPDPSNRFFDNGTGSSATAGWWYPVVGTIVDGQIASNMQSAHEVSLGTSMNVAKIRLSGSDSETTPHVVVGTTGGYVYAITPTGAPPADNASTSPIAASLRHLSTHLGTFVVGLDCGDLDGDEPGGDIDDEIVCGTWLDNGTYTDWDPTSPDLTKNRAHLYVLDPVVGASSPTFLALDADLTGDDLVGAGNGIGSGVTGVKIDDVDGDGVAEIWCSDGTGYLYLFAKDSSGGWHCVYRSDDLCAYPGFYNNLHPIKGEGGETTKLAVQSPGYFFLFDVDADEIDFP